MDLSTDRRVVLTLDAGGTNFVFSAMQGGKEVVAPITLPSRADDLDACLDQMMRGFAEVRDRCPTPPVALSFAFPGPADYPNGIIGDLPNLPAFRGGGVALGPALQDHFGLPTYINNDGDLFAYGEAIGGFLPYVNGLLAQAGSPKRFRNLLGATFGTGFGAGIVRDGQLHVGDNSVAAEIWVMRHKHEHQANAEDGVSIRAVRRVYAQHAKLPVESVPEPKEIFRIARGESEGDNAAGLEAFRMLGEVAGDALAQAVTLIDGLIVIGGGLTGAQELFMPALVSEMSSTYTNLVGETFPRLAMRVFNLEDPVQLEVFLKGEAREIPVPRSTRKVAYDPLQRIGVGMSRLGTSAATAFGAYAFALRALDAPSM